MNAHDQSSATPAMSVDQPAAMALPAIGDLQRRLSVEDATFSTWRNTVPDKHWAKLDLSALRIGYELGLAVAAAQSCALRAENAASRESMMFTLGEATALVEFFGGNDDAEVMVSESPRRAMDVGPDAPAGKYAWDVSYPDEGATWLDPNGFSAEHSVILGPTAPGMSGYAGLSELHREPTNVECHKLDSSTQVFFYEQDFYVLSNFSAFSIEWTGGRVFQTSEHFYHWLKFDGYNDAIAELVYSAASAHEAFKIAERHKDSRRPDWDDVKVGLMKDILREKVRQHEYVRRKLQATGDRELIEDSWRDSFWGWGPDRDGQNMLGKIWMEIRAELVANLHGGVLQHA